MSQATSTYLNQKIRTREEAVQDMCSRLFGHLHKFLVRSVFFTPGYATSSPRGLEPDLDALAEAYGVYGQEGNKLIHVHDCGTLEEAETLALHLNERFPHV